MTKIRTPIHPQDYPSEKWVEWSLLVATAVSAGAILAIFLLLVYFCLPLFTWARLSQVLSWHWQPVAGKFGILPMCAGSLALSVLALALAFPPAIGICTLVHVLSRSFFSRFLLALIHFMTSIPTVIIGFVSVFVLVPLLRERLAAGSGFSLITAALALSVLILPTIVLVFHARLKQLDPLLRLTAEAMGFTPIQQMRYVLLPASARGLAAAAVLGFGRAIGDTLISLMLAGNAAQFPGSFFTSIRSLTAHIALVLATDSQSMAYQSVFASGLLLFLLMGAFNFLIQKTGQKIGGSRHEKNL
jgi:phosphate transport system permease protein